MENRSGGRSGVKICSTVLCRRADPTTGQTPQRVNPNFCESTKIILQSPSKLLVELLQIALIITESTHILSYHVSLFFVTILPLRVCRRGCSANLDSTTTCAADLLFLRDFVGAFNSKILVSLDIGRPKLSLNISRLRGRKNSLATALNT
jgi:hypothetical protein